MFQNNRSLPSSYFLLPRSSSWGDDEVLVQRPNKKYTVQNYENLFNDMNFTIGNDLLEIAYLENCEKDRRHNCACDKRPRCLFEFMFFSDK